MESREVSVFRTMNGETDGMTTPFQLREVPLYNANMEKGDYSIYHWPSPGGQDSGVSFSQMYNKDPEIGRLIRTTNFRLALSHATDRESINETVYLGVGVIQARTPHPSTPYYGGPAVAELNISYDVDLANQMLDDLGLTARDDDGFRLKADGSGEAILMRLTVSPNADEDLTVAELLQPMWEEVGIKSVVNLKDSVRSEVNKGNEFLSVGAGSAYQADPWSVDWTSLAPMRGGNPFAHDIGLWIETAGAQGMAPGPDTSYLPLAPAENFAVDPTGMIMRTIEIWQEGRAFGAYDPRRVALAKELFMINAEQMWTIPFAAFLGTRRGVFINRNNMFNQPRTHVRDHNGFHAWTYYFIGGKDNYNHPDNRSGLQSESFLGGG